MELMGSLFSKTDGRITSFLALPMPKPKPKLKRKPKAIIVQWIPKN